MRYAEIITESPQIIPPTDFGMGNDSHRADYTRYLLSIYPQVILEETPVYKLYRCGSGSVVHIFMLEKPHGKLVYFVKCEVAVVSFIGQVVTQVSLWRDDDSLGVVGITNKVFEMLLAEWPTVMSDEQQTVMGQSFWRRRLVVADAAGLRVGLADMRKKSVDWKDSSQPYVDWIRDHSGAWTTDVAAQNLRFVISRTDPAV